MTTFPIALGNMDWIEVPFHRAVTHATGRTVQMVDVDGDVWFTDKTCVRLQAHHYEDYPETFYIGVPK